MTGIERLEELQQQRKEYADKWHEQRVAVTKALYSILEDLNTGPAPLLPLREDEVVGIDTEGYGSPDWQVRKEIYFVNQDPKNETRGYDFGSYFSLYITAKHIQVNHGSCGTWGLEDKGQWTRLILMKAIFDHEKDIIDTIAPLVDLSVKSKFYEADHAINEINRAIEKAKSDKEKAEIRAKLAPGKWLALKSSRWIYDLDENGQRDWDKRHKEFYYTDFQKIVKITEVSVLVNECDNQGSPYTWINRRLKLDQVLRDIQYHNLNIIDSPNQTPPQEDEGSK